jgi:hypothetical protein
VKKKEVYELQQAPQLLGPVRRIITAKAPGMDWGDDSGQTRVHVSHLPQPAVRSMKPWYQRNCNHESLLQFYQQLFAGRAD